MRDFEVQSRKAMDDAVLAHLGHARFTCQGTSHTQHRTVGQLGQDQRRNPGTRAHATVHRLTASNSATPTPKGEGKGRERGKGMPHHQQRHRLRVFQRRTEKECFCCKKTEHMKSNCRNRQKDLALTEGWTVAAATTAGAGEATLQLGALPRIAQSTSMNLVFATLLNEDA